MYIMIIPTIPISWIKNYTNLAKVSLTGIVAALFGAFATLLYCGLHLGRGSHVDGPIVFFDIKQVFGYIGIAMFAFEGNGVVVNLR